MDIGSILIGLAALVLVVFLISQPLLDQRRQHANELSEVDRLREQRDRILLTLRDLDFDHASSKIPEEDYTSLRAKLVAEGAAVLKQIDDLTPVTPDRLEDQLEQAIRARRQGRAPAAPAGINSAKADSPKADEIERAIAAHRKVRPIAASGEEIYCQKCGQAALTGDKFCAKCGAKLLGAPSTKESA